MIGASARSDGDLVRFVQIDPPGGAQHLGECGLADARVDLWAFPLTAHPLDVERWQRELSADETATAQRFKRPADRDRYIVAHGVTRRLLGGYRGVTPRALRFERAEGGKPLLAATIDVPPLHFNLCHSGDGALLAVGRRELGVDIELARSDIDVASIAARFFCESERSAIVTAPASMRADTFLRHWVAKEAVLKAEGVGLARPLDSFAVAFSQEGRSVHLTTPDGGDLPADWQVQMLRMLPGWHGALCAPGGAEVRLRAPTRPAASPST